MLGKMSMEELQQALQQNLTITSPTLKSSSRPRSLASCPLTSTSATSGGGKNIFHTAGGKVVLLEWVKGDETTKCFGKFGHNCFCCATWLEGTDNCGVSAHVRERKKALAELLAYFIPSGMLNSQETALCEPLLLFSDMEANDFVKVTKPRTVAEWIDFIYDKALVGDSQPPVKKLAVDTSHPPATTKNEGEDNNISLPLFNSLFGGESVVPIYFKADVLEEESWTEALQTTCYAITWLNKKMGDLQLSTKFTDAIKLLFDKLVCAIKELQTQSIENVACLGNATQLVLAYGTIAEAINTALDLVKDEPKWNKFKMQVKSSCAARMDEVEKMIDSKILATAQMTRVHLAAADQVLSDRIEALERKR